MSEFKCNQCGSEKSAIIADKIKDWEYGVSGEYDYHECSNCGIVQLHPFPTVEDLVVAYDIDYHGYLVSDKKGGLFNAMFNFKQWLYLRKIKKITGVAKGKILDIGCGVGEFLSLYKGDSNFELEGIDFSQKAVDQCLQKGIKAFCGTFYDYESEDLSFDMIVMNNYLEHTLDPKYELNKSYKLLKDGAYLVGEVPGYKSFDRMIFGRYWGGNHVPRHTYQFNEPYLMTAIKEAGFKKVIISHELNTGHWALSVQNFFQRNTKDLKNNKKLVAGRSWYYFYLLLLFIPINVINILFRRSGVVKFYAEK